MPYKGTWEQTRKMRRVTAVHSTFWLNGTCGRGEGGVSGRAGVHATGGETHLAVGRGDFRQEREERTDEVEEPDWRK